MAERVYRQGSIQNAGRSDSGDDDDDEPLPNASAAQKASDLRVKTRWMQPRAPRATAPAPTTESQGSADPFDDSEPGPSAAEAKAASDARRLGKAIAKASALKGR